MQTEFDPARRAEALLDLLDDVHGELELRLDGLARLARGPCPPRQVYAEARLKLTKASRERWTLLNGHVLPFLYVHAPDQDAELRALERHAQECQASSVAHLGRWPLQQAIEDWPSYARASDRIRADMVDRLALERDVLRPLLIRIANA